ncbi:hypothetical protein ACFLS9_07155, partial [Bacteroidota bacterium]
MKKIFLFTFVLVLIFTVNSYSQINPLDFTENFCFIKMDCPSIPDAIEAANYINDLGGVVAVIGSPRYMIGWITPDKIPLILSFTCVIEIFYGVLPPELFGDMSNDEMVLAEYYNTVASGFIFDLDLESSPAWYWEQDGCIPDDQPIGDEESLYKTQGICNLNTHSEYMVGSVSCPVFFVESSGVTDLNQYTWTVTDENTIKTQLTDAWTIWAYTASVNSINLFFIPVYYDNNTPSVVNQPYEPINYPSTSDNLWIGAIMSNLGFSSGTKFSRLNLFNESVINSSGSKWAYSAFVCYNPQPGAPTTFTNGACAYAYLGGPYTQILYKNDGWMVNQFFRVFGHESAHIFHAFDEYVQSPASNCTSFFNGVQNSNYHGSTCMGTTNCCMVDNSFFGTGLTRQWNMCNPTKAHIGWTNLTPMPTLLAPANNAQLNAGNIAFNWNRNTANPVINSTLRIYDLLNNSVAYCQNLFNSSATNVNLSGGTYSWSVYNGVNNVYNGYAEVAPSNWLLQITSQCYSLSLEPVSQNVSASSGGQFQLEAWIGNPNAVLPPDDFNGVSFDVSWDNSSYVGYNSSTPGPFLGSSPLTIVQPFTSHIEAGVTRTAGGTTGSGKVLDLTFDILSVPASQTVVTFSISNITGMQSDGSTLCLQPVGSVTCTLDVCISVWPGDADNNGVANVADILPLGFYYGNSSGASRPGGSCLWQSQCCPLSPAWSPANAVYADCNGDGTVNVADVLCIGLNYGNIHRELHEPQKTSIYKNSKVNPKLNYAIYDLSKKQISESELNEGEEFYVGVKLINGNELIGLAFGIEVGGTGRVKGAEIINDWEEDGMIKGDIWDKEAISISKFSREEGRIDIGITNPGNMIGEKIGEVALLKMKVTDKGKLNVNITEAKGMDKNGKLIELNKSIKEKELDLESNEKLTEVKLGSYPNPFNSQTQISFYLQNKSNISLMIFNAIGEEVIRLYDGVDLVSGKHSVVWNA